MRDPPMGPRVAFRARCVHADSTVARGDAHKPSSRPASARTTPSSAFRDVQMRWPEAAQHHRQIPPMYLPTAGALLSPRGGQTNGGGLPGGGASLSWRTAATEPSPVREYFTPTISSADVERAPRLGLAEYVHSRLTNSLRREARARARLSELEGRLSSPSGSPRRPHSARPVVCSIAHAATGAASGGPTGAAADDDDAPADGAATEAEEERLAQELRESKAEHAALRSQTRVQQAQIAQLSKDAARGRAAARELQEMRAREAVQRERQSRLLSENVRLRAVYAEHDSRMQRANAGLRTGGEEVLERARRLAAEAAEAADRMERDAMEALRAAQANALAVKRITPRRASPRAMRVY